MQSDLRGAREPTNLYHNNMIWISKKHALIDECAADNLIIDACIEKGDANIHISFAWIH